MEIENLKGRLSQHINRLLYRLLNIHQHRAISNKKTGFGTTEGKLKRHVCH